MQMQEIGTALLAALMWIMSLFTGAVAAAPALVEEIVYEKIPLVQKEKTVILFGGDMMFDRTVRLAMEENGDDFILSCVKDTLASADLVVANLEGPITSNPSKSLGSVIGSPENFTFTFPTSTASLLKRHNISLVALGNNHITNFGGEGVRETKDWLSRAGVRHFGDPYVSENDRVARLDLGGIPFSFVSWSDWTGGTKEEVLAQITHEKLSGRRPVVMAHWGEEYVAANGNQKALAKAFVDAGAVLVIGGHPHVVQEREFYRGVPIYYSLGNFVFDQYWNEEVRTGLLVRVTFDAEGVYGIDEFETYLESDRRTCIREEKAKSGP